MNRAETKAETLPRLVEGVQECVQVACGVWHTAVVTAVGGLYCFGQNNHGQLGCGRKLFTGGALMCWPASVRSKFSPELVQFPSEDTDIGRLSEVVAVCSVVCSVQVACGSRHTVALSASGEVFAFGWNGYGQCMFGQDKSDKKDDVATSASASVASGSASASHATSERKASPSASPASAADREEPLAKKSKTVSGSDAKAASKSERDRDRAMDTTADAAEAETASSEAEDIVHKPYKWRLDKPAKLVAAGQWHSIAVL